MSAAVLVQRSFQYQPTSFTRVYLLLAGNDTVPTSVWRGLLPACRYNNPRVFG